MLDLRYHTPPEWLELVRDNMVAFLQDHAANERKVSQSALGLAVQHPKRRELVDAMVELACEELEHFRQVYALLTARGSDLGVDGPDPYMTELRRGVRKPDVDAYLLDRLLLFGIIEARGFERFHMLATGLDDTQLSSFYTELSRSEARHHATYLTLARTYFDEERVEQRLDALLDREAEVMRGLPLRPALH
jgi:tRNA-(ms[2]io[6]A)-hydroxylase